MAKVEDLMRLGASCTSTREHVIVSGRRYWPIGEELLRALSRATPAAEVQGSFRGNLLVELPDWAADFGVGSPPSLLVDARAVGEGLGPAFDRCDWWLAAHLMLSGAMEREAEARNGPCHSYHFRLKVDTRMFAHAWVNRILLVLRRMAAREAGEKETKLFGPFPAADIIVTHDVDAITRRPELRLKQSGFAVFNAGREIGRRAPLKAVLRLHSAARHLFGSTQLWTFDRLLYSLRRRGMRSRFHVYGGPSGRQRLWPGMLMDPGYDCAEPRLVAFLRSLVQDGFVIGVHPSYASFASTASIAAEKNRLAEVLGCPVTACRQHWLRFSWARTWAAQAAAGISCDSTLGFNDRPGFRNGAALAFQPFDSATRETLPIVAQPLVLMDSHVYDYDLDGAAHPERFMEPWIAEIKAVGGLATILWHPHTLDPTYGWERGFEALLDLIAAN
jgi:hypothetical protein